MHILEAISKCKELLHEAVETQFSAKAFAQKTQDAIRQGKSFAQAYRRSICNNLSFLQFVNSVARVIQEEQ